MKKVTVVGAGFAGLTTALRLAQKGFKVEVFEKSSRVGGLLGTHQTEQGLAEQAANSLIRTERTEALFKELDLIPCASLKKSTRRFLFREEPRQWPLDFLETLCFASKLLPKLLLNRKALRPQPHETLQQWGDRNLGAAPTRFILGPAIQGIYANDILGLSASLILGAFLNRPKKKYKGLLTGHQGMQEVIHALETKVRAAGVEIHLNSSVDLSQISDPVVIATSASAAAALLQERSPETSEVLAKIPMSSLISATLFFEKPQTQYQGFGCLIPRGYDLKALGILMNSYIFEGRAKIYNETWILGGKDQRALLDLSDTEILKLLAEERFRILQDRASLVDYRVFRWKDALPYYGLQTESALQGLQRTLPRGVYLNGNYLDGIGLSKILERSERLAEEISREF